MVDRVLSQSAKYLTEVRSVRRHHDPLLGNRDRQEFVVRQLLQSGVTNCRAYVEAIGRENASDALTGVVLIQQQPYQTSITSMFSSGYLACQYSTG